MLADSLLRYDHLLFDCDGVLLKSNILKSDAFYESVLQYGVKYADMLRRYHVQNGGVSRYEKFRYFFNEIVKAESIDEKMQEALAAYAKNVRLGLLNCEIAAGLSDLRSELPHAKWLVVSGGDQLELRSIFKSRDIDRCFNGGIFGSPDCKETIIRRELDQNNISKNSLFFGDSKYDFEVAKKFSFDFIFVSQWSEVEDWQIWVSENRIKTISSLSELVEVLPRSGGS